MVIPRALLAESSRIHCSSSSGRRWPSFDGGGSNSRQVIEQIDPPELCLGE